MTSILAVLLHGDDLDLIYFWSSILIVALPLTVFGVIAYLVVKGYRKREQGPRSTEQKASN